jgi:predicted outer membrane repeat protein
VDLKNCQFSGNRATAYGGALQITKAGVLAVNSTFSRNYAGIAGGAVDLELTASSSKMVALSSSSFGQWTYQVRDQGDTVHILHLSSFSNNRNRAVSPNSPLPVIITDSTYPE